ncbi:MAG: hypothetical protein QHH13_00180 [Melioribacter sp.]|nr:hypothetical protein [Melioribacter sp.]
MTLMRILVIMSIILCYFQAYRYRKHEMFYYFFILAASDPILIIRSLLLHNNNIWNSYYTVMTVFLIFSLPRLNIRYKIGILLGVIIYFFLDPRELKVFMVFNLLQLLIIGYFVNLIINDIWNKKEIKYYLLILVVYHSIFIISRYIYYTDITLHLKVYNYRLMFVNFLVLLNTVLGPEKGFVLKSKLIDKLIRKRKVVVYGDSGNIFSVNDLKKYGLTDRSTQTYKQGLYLKRNSRATLLIQKNN